MKKSTFVKILISVAALATVAVCAFIIFKKFFASGKKKCSDNDNYDDKGEDSEEVKREYVSIPFEENPETSSDNDSSDSVSESDDNNLESELNALESELNKIDSDNVSKKKA